MNTSKTSCASRSSSPFVFPLHPISGTVGASCPANSRFSFRGRHSSSRTFMVLGQQSLFDQFQNAFGLASADAGEISEEVLESVARIQIINESLYRHARPSEYGR